MPRAQAADPRVRMRFLSSSQIQGPRSRGLVAIPRHSPAQHFATACASTPCDIFAVSLYRRRKNIGCWGAQVGYSASGAGEDDIIAAPKARHTISHWLSALSTPLSISLPLPSSSVPSFSNQLVGAVSLDTKWIWRTVDAWGAGGGPPGKERVPS